MSSDVAWTSSIEPPKATFISVLAAIGFGTVPFFAKNLIDAGFSAQTIAFYRYFPVALLLSPFLLIGPESRSATIWGVLGGAAMGMGWAGYVKAVESIPVSTVGIVYMTYPMFTVLIGWLWFRQRLTARSIIASMIVLAATVIATSPVLAINEVVSNLLVALAAPITFGFAINILAVKLSSISPLSRIASVAWGAVLGLLPLILMREHEQLLPTSLLDVSMIVGIAIITALVPQLLYVISAPRIGAAKSAIVGSVELPTMLLIGWAVFQETIDLTQIVAAIMIITAVIMTPVVRPELR